MGYDVWLGNARGNTYSQGHVKYKRNGWRDERQKYWNFSWHEIGKYDLPASIDYIVGITHFPKIHYIGKLKQCFSLLFSENCSCPNIRSLFSIPVRNKSSTVFIPVECLILIFIIFNARSLHIAGTTQTAGHSQGTTSFFVMMSECPEYNEKILFMTALAPPVFMGNVKNPLLQLNVRNLDTIEVKYIKFQQEKLSICL